jgi:hypothetical protein
MFSVAGKRWIHATKQSESVLLHTMMMILVILSFLSGEREREIPIQKQSDTTYAIEYKLQKAVYI